jgi:2-hydroxymuconate-semialdehyde hydrolase
MSDAPAPEGRHVEIPGGQRLWIEAAGSGPPVVFVHGLPGLGRDFRPLTRRLTDRFHCLAYDRAGYGASSPNTQPEAAGVAQNVDHLLALLDAVDIGPTSLVGWSYGGPIVLAAAARAPQRISRIVLLGAPSPNFRWPGKLADRLLQTPIGGPALRFMRVLGPRAFRRPLDEAYGARAPDSVLEDFFWGISCPGAIEQLLSEGRQLDLAATPVTEVRQRCLVIQGEDDAMVPASEGARLAASLADAELWRIPECGHWPFATHAAEVAGRMSPFLAGLADG